MTPADLTRLDDELDAPLTREEIAEDEAFWAEVNAPLVVDEAELSDRERAWIKWREENG